MEKIFNMLDSFSQEVQRQLQNYVYRLVDPRNAITFYVGKGKGNRVFDHIKCAIKTYGGDDEDESDLKYQQINEIKASGLKVIHLIHRWGLSDSEAFEVEAALIDAYSGLTNKQSGHDADRGIANIEQIISSLQAETYIEPDFEYIIVKTKQSTIETRLFEYNTLEEARYDATSHSWPVNPSNWTNCKYVFSVTDQIVKEIYVFDKWLPDEKMKSRYYFVCPNENIQKADNEIRKEFIGKRIPEKYCKKGMARPVLKGGKR